MVSHRPILNALLILVVLVGIILVGSSCAPEPTATHIPGDEFEGVSTDRVYVTIVDAIGSNGERIRTVPMRDVPLGVTPVHEIKMLQAGAWVELIGQNETEALVITNDGTEGWIDKQFVKELR